MILVKSVELVNTGEDNPNPFVYQYAKEPKSPWPPPEPGVAVARDFEVETVEGKWFHNPAGVSVVIGWTKEVQLALGLPFEAFDNMEKQLSDDHLHITKLTNLITALERQSIWEFIKRKWKMRKVRKHESW